MTANDGWREGRIPFSLFVGVTGHRSLPTDPAFHSQLGAAIRRIHALRPETPQTPVVLTAVSQLAEGADRAVPSAILSDGGMLEVVLPMAPAVYSADFASEESRSAFHALLGRASKTTVQGEHPLCEADRDRCYQAAGRIVVERCDVLIALWDGKPARGRGGTAEIVAYARSTQKPLLWISTEAPFELTEECTAAVLEPETFHDLEEFNRVDLSDTSFAAAVMAAGRELLPVTARPSIGLEAVRDWIAPHFVRADLLAMRSQKRFNQLSSAVYFFAFLAVVAGITQALFFAADPLACAPEAALLVAILVVFAFERRRRMGTHERWMAYRFFAERLRSAFYLGAVSAQEAYEVEVASMQMDDAAERWLPRALAQVYWQCPRVRLQPGDVPALRSLLVEGWVGAQIAYHRSAEKGHTQRQHILSTLLYVVFALTLVAVVLHMAGIWGEESVVPKLLILAAIAMPALGGALSGVRSHGDADRHAERHKEMQGALGREEEQLKRAESLRVMRRQAIRIEEAMLSENSEWLRQIRFIVLELPGG